MFCIFDDPNSILVVCELCYDFVRLYFLIFGLISHLVCESLSFIFFANLSNFPTIQHVSKILIYILFTICSIITSVCFLGCELIIILHLLNSHYNLGCE